MHTDTERKAHLQGVGPCIKPTYSLLYLIYSHSAFSGFTDNLKSSRTLYQRISRYPVSIVVSRMPTMLFPFSVSRASTRFRTKLSFFQFGKHSRQSHINISIKFKPSLLLVIAEAYGQVLSIDPCGYLPGRCRESMFCSTCKYESIERRTYLAMLSK